MARYTDVDKLIKELSTMYKKPTSAEDFVAVGYDKAIADVVVTAHKQPTADVRENVTARWVEMGENEDGTHNICCSACGKGKLKSRGHANSIYTYQKYKFCIECGAKMQNDKNHHIRLQTV